MPDDKDNPNPTSPFLGTTTTRSTPPIASRTTFTPMATAADADLEDELESRGEEEREKDRAVDPVLVEEIAAQLQEGKKFAEVTFPPGAGPQRKLDLIQEARRNEPIEFGEERPRR